MIPAFSKHALRRARERHVCLPLLEALAAGRWPGSELRGREEIALPLRGGSALVVKFHHADRREVATVYVRTSDEERRLSAERGLRGLSISRFCAHTATS